MIYITGDTHGDLDLYKLNSKFFQKGKKLTKNDYVIICGDFACCWDNGAYDKYIQNWYNEKPWTTLFVDGNHENHDALDAYPVEIWNGGKVHKISDSIIHLMRGQVFTIEGKKIFTFGGAQSHDMWHRKEGVSWWAREMPSDEEYEEGFRNLEAVGNKVDYVITHCAPDQVQNGLFQWRHYEHDKLTNYLEIVRQTITFDHWYFGHYHDDNDIGAKFHCLYDNVIELGDYIFEKRGLNGTDLIGDILSDV